MNEEFVKVVWMLISAAAGLGIFLFGMKNMSEGIQTIAGAGLRRMITAVTENRFLAVGVGIGFTCLVQTSTVTTTFVVGLVNAGFMALHQAVGVIIGANIGTTITGWILVLKVGAYGLPLFGISGFIYLFAKRDGWRYSAMTAMGVGMMFFGLEMMKEGVAPMREMPTFVEAFTWFQADTTWGVLRAVMVGCVLTFLVQSSSGALGITIGLAAAGMLDFPTAAALVMGQNIGTTITAWLASLGANRNAKRAAWGHIIFNIIGAAWVIALFWWYIPLVDNVVEWLYGIDPMNASMEDFRAPGLTEAQVELAYGSFMTAAIASVHTGFNVTNTLIFLPFVRMYARFLERLIPDRGREVPHLKHLNVRVVDTPALAIAQSGQEVLQMGRGCVKMLNWTREIALNGEPKGGASPDKLVEKVFHREEVLDNIEREVIVFMTEVLDGSVPHVVAEEARQQLRITHEYESVADAIASILKGYLKLREEELVLTESQLASLRETHDQVTRYLTMVVEAHERGDESIVQQAQSLSAQITRRVKQLRDEYVEQIVETRIDPRLSLAYITILTQYRRVKEHALNVAEALAGGKPLHYAP